MPCAAATIATASPAGPLPAITRSHDLRARYATYPAASPLAITGYDRRYHHCKRTSSPQKPGPIESSTPYYPGRATPDLRKSAATNRTEAEEIFPTASSDRHDRASAHFGISSASWIASNTFGPPVWAIQ